jgi:hypothetical protein
MQYTKIVILITAFIFSFNLNQIKAQSEYTSKNVIKANVLGAAIGGFSISYERAFAENKSAVLTGRFMFYNFEDTQGFNFGNRGDVSIDYSIDFALVGVLPEVRFHVASLFEQNAPEGLYLAPYGGFTRATFDVNSLNSNFIINGGTSAFFVEFGGLLGYQFVIGDQLTLDFFSGLGYSSFTLEKVSVEVISTTSSEQINDFVDFKRTLPLGATLTGFLPRFGASIGLAF